MPRMELDDETRAVVLLNEVERLGAVNIAKLVGYYGRRADYVLKAPERGLREAGLSSTVIAGIRAARQAADDPEDEHRGIDPKTAALLRDPSLGFVHFRDADYPPLLRHIYAPPAMLYARGSLEGVGESAVAMVGSRSGSRDALEAAYQIAYGLAEAGIVVVSGLARGIDAAAHKGALDGGGRTIAVLPSGLGTDIYPFQNKKLSERIIESGALVSELPMAYPVRKTNFEQRNRIISGMCWASVIVQAQMRSGSLITARHALDAGRTVFAAEWGASPLAAGSNMLIEEGAEPVESAGCILKRLRRPAPTETAIDLESAAQTLWKALSEEPTYIDALKHSTGLHEKVVLSALQILEEREMARQHPGMRYTRLGTPAQRESTARPRAKPKTEARPKAEPKTEPRPRAAARPRQEPSGEERRETAAPSFNIPKSETKPKAEPKRRSGSAPPDLEGAEAAVWEALTDQPMHIDAVAQATGLPAQEVLTTLLTLELKDLAQQLPGMLYSRVKIRR